MSRSGRKRLAVVLFAAASLFLDGTILDRAAQGVERKDLRKIVMFGKCPRCDLSDGTFSGQDLTGADLSKANLANADLSGANLKDAKLRDANLGGANLQDANLTGADLHGANLVGTQLRGAVLKGANLTEARLIGAELNKADLTGANIEKARFQDARLSQTIWIDGQPCRQGSVGACDQETAAKAKEAAVATKKVETASPRTAARKKKAQPLEAPKASKQQPNQANRTDAKKPETKKSEARTAETKKAEARKAEARKAEARKAEAKKAAAKKAKVRLPAWATPTPRAKPPLAADHLQSVAGQGASDPARAGEPRAEASTPHALAFRWPVKGDANANAEITVAYRSAGGSDWRPALSLLRTRPTPVSEGHRVPDGFLFAGSIVNLEPGTPYDVRLTLRDPDGGDTERAMTLATTREPVTPDGMRTRYAVPGGGGGGGTRENPFRGLAEAVSEARPGDLVLFAPGVYAEGDVRQPRSGEIGQPIVYRGEGFDVVFDGGGAEALLDLSGRSHIWLDNLTLRNAKVLVEAGRANHIVARRNRFEIAERGFRAWGAIYDESTGFFITDNIFVGKSRWPRPEAGFAPYEAVNVTGAGHVVAYNRMSRVSDGIQSGQQDAQGRLSASDIYANDITSCTDDGIAVDDADTNVRVFRNRITNCWIGIRSRSVFGGPVYVYRNSLLNIQRTPFKLENETSGNLLIHNTTVTVGSPFSISTDRVFDTITRNNIVNVPSGRGIGDIGIIIPIGLRSHKGAGNAFCHGLSSSAWRFLTRILAPT